MRRCISFLGNAGRTRICVCQAMSSRQGWKPASPPGADRRGVDRFQAERTGVVVMPVSFPFRLLNV